MKRKLKVYTKNEAINIRSLDKKTGLVSNNLINVEKGENTLFNITKNEKGVLISSPIAKLFGLETDYFREKGKEFKAVNSKR